MDSVIGTVTLAIPHASKSLGGENSSRNRLSDSMYEIMGSGMSIDLQKTYPKLGEPRECTVLKVCSTPVHSSQNSGFAQTLAGAGLSESDQVGGRGTRSIS
jgi:hypothetical protein